MTDQCSRRYLGIQGICIFPDSYSIYTLGHMPITEVNATADVLATMVSENLNIYNIANKVEYIISDTTAVMPATTRNAGLKWSPCYCHILNLVAEEFTRNICELIDPILDLQKHLSKSTLFTQFCINHGSKITSIPTPTRTRWYSYCQTFKAIHRLQPLIIEFAQKKYINLDSFPNDIWNMLPMICSIFATIKIAYQGLESDKFGTKSLIIPAFRMVAREVNSLDPIKFGFVQSGFQASMSNHWMPYFEINRMELFIANRLNPSTMNSSLNTDEIVEADQCLRSLINEESQIFHPVETNDTQNQWCVNNSPTIQNDELISYINSIIGMAGNPTNFDLWNFWSLNKN